MSVTTNFNFIPVQNSSPPYSFSFTAESETWTGNCTWNMAGQRWYLSIYDTSMTLLISTPMISSPLGSPQNLVPGVFSSTEIYYYGNNQSIQVVTAS